MDLDQPTGHLVLLVLFYLQLRPEPRGTKRVPAGLLTRAANWRQDARKFPPTKFRATQNLANTGRLREKLSGLEPVKNRFW